MTTMTSSAVRLAFPTLVLAALLPVFVAGQSADSAAVAEVVHAYHAALSSGDGDAAMALLAGDALIVESGGVETREQYQGGHLGGDMAFAQAIERESGAVQVRVEGDVAWTVSTSMTQGRYRDRDIDSRGAELMVLSRRDGSWVIRAIHWSSRSAR